MENREDQPALATLRRFYTAESAYLAASGGDFSGIAATLDPDCVIYQPASLPCGEYGAVIGVLKHGCGLLRSNGPLWKLKMRSSTRTVTSS